MTKCMFCNARDNGFKRIVADKPIFDKSINVGFFGEVRVFGMIEYVDNEDILGISIQSDNGFIDVPSKHIKYCPMCGRKLEDVDVI